MGIIKIENRRFFIFYRIYYFDYIKEKLKWFTYQDVLNWTTHEKRAYNHRETCFAMRVDSGVTVDKMMQKLSRSNFFFEILVKFFSSIIIQLRRSYIMLYNITDRTFALYPAFA